MAHKEREYNSAAKPLPSVNPDKYATTAIPYCMTVRIINILEDLHSEMQLPIGERFAGYPIEDFEEIDTRIRDNMLGLKLSLEALSQCEE